MKANVILYRKRHLVILAISCFALLAALPYIFRSLWFDEVLTMEVFVNPLPLGKIYWAYNIPNNHIIYSLAQKVWTLIMAYFGATRYFAYRLVSLAAAVPAIWILASRLMRRTGAAPGAMTAAALCISSIFVLFSTCIRGYMFSFLFCAAAFCAVDDIVRKNRKIDYIMYFVWSLLAVGTIPANLAALGAAVGFFFPTLVFRRKRYGTTAYLACIPFLAMILFYLPIARKFFANMERGEGWTSPGAAANNLYISFFLLFAGILPFAVAGAVRMAHKIPRLRWNVLFGFLIFLIPVPAFFVFKNAAYPRVFFPLFPVWTFLMAYLFSMYLKSVRTPFWRLLPFVIQIAVTGFLVQNAPAVSDFFFFSGRDDDLTMPYHLRLTFTPAKILQEIKDRMDRGEKLYVFSTFYSDAPANAYQVMLMDLPQDLIRTNAFGGYWEPELRQKYKEGYHIYFITGGYPDLYYNIKRFGLHGSEPVLIQQYQRLDRIY